MVVGGYNDVDGYLSSVVTLLPGSANWTDLAPLPQGLSYASASIMGGRLRVLGGFNTQDGYTSEVIIYSHCQKREGEIGRFSRGIVIILRGYHVRLCA